MRIAYSKDDLRMNLLLSIASEKGYFKEEDLDVELLPIVNDSFVTIDNVKRDQLDSLMSGDVAISYQSPEISFSLESAQPGKIKIIKAFQEDDNSPRNVFVVRGNSNINSIKDLKGKTIGLPLYRNESISKVALKNMLESAGLTLNDVKLKEMRNTNEAEKRIIVNDIDAGVTSYPVSLLGSYHGSTKTLEERFLLKYFMNPIPSRAIVISSAYLKDNLGVVQKFNRVLDKSIKFEKENQDQLLEILKRHATITSEMEKVLPKEIFVIETVAEPYVELLKNYQDKLYENGIVSEKVDIEGMSVG